MVIDFLKMCNLVLAMVWVEYEQSHRFIICNALVSRQSNFELKEVNYGN